MVFSSSIFLFGFLPITLLGYFICPKKMRNIWLLLVSLLFFGWSQPEFLWIIILSIVINYIGGIVVGGKEDTLFRKVSMLIVVLANLGLLFYYKYFNFTAGIFINLFGLTVSLKEIILPIGISFFTFQGMSYAIDVYRRQVPVQKNLVNVALYVTLFPQLIAGPIVRYIDVEREVIERSTSWEDMAEGIKRFIIGLFKKAVIANTMAGTADAIWNLGVEQNTVAIAWLGIISYSLQIFFDFSGYSDMAIGLGRIFGFHFNENFNFPYISKSIGEFWRRWHISLSTWFRDYVYIPLGGNRRHVYRNVSVVFILTGIWHGAAWHYILWGIWHGIFSIAERLLKGVRIGVKVPGVIKHICKHIYTLVVVLIGWVLFRAEDMQNAWEYLKSMVGLSTISDELRFSVGWYLDWYVVTILILGVVMSTPLITLLWAKIKTKLNASVCLVIRNTVLIAMLLWAILRVVSNTYNPFIYFQF